MSRTQVLAHVVAGRISQKWGAKLLDAQYTLKKAGVEPTRRGVLSGVAAGACSRWAANRWFAADRAVRRELSAAV